MFVDCLKMSGNLEDIRVFKQNSDDIEVIMKIDGVVIPNIIVPISLFEEIEKGRHWEFYGIFKKSKDKVKNKGIIYAIKPAGGSIKSVTKLRFTVPGMMAFGAILAYALTYILTWAVAIMPMAAKDAPINLLRGGRKS